MPGSSVSSPAPPEAKALDLTEGRAGAAPLYVLPDGTFSQTAAGPSPQGLAARPALVAAARWISMRRGTSFERLFVPSPFHPERPVRTERLSAAQAQNLLVQLRGAIAAAAVGSAA